MQAQKNPPILQPTPSFIKKDSNSLETYNNRDLDCDFSDDMIDEHVGPAMQAVMMSPRENASGKESLCRVLRSIEDIQNTSLNNNRATKDLYLDPLLTSKIEGGGKYETAQFKQENRRKTDTKGSRGRLQQNISQHLVRKERKLRDLKQFLQINEMKQCTFTPNTQQSYASKTPKRNLEQFLRNQLEHVNKIDKKREDLKKKKEELSRLEESFRPKINKNPNNQMEKNRSKKPAHQRLYELKENKAAKNKVVDEPEIKGKVKVKSGPQPQINRPLTLKVNSNARPTTCQLYQDAERRNNLLKSIEKSKPQVEPCVNRPTNRINEKYGAQKFIKQFCYVLQCMKLLPGGSSSYASMDEYASQQDQSPDINAREFSLNEFNGILRGLGFLLYEDTCENELANKERALAFEGFEILEQYGVSIRNVCVFLLCILGIFNVNPVNFYDVKQEHKKNSLFEIDDKEGRRLHKYFDLLYRNHLISSSKPKKSLTPTHKTTPAPSTYISSRHGQHTKQLAQKYRTKMIERTNQRFISNNIDIVLPTEDNMLTHEDLLVIDNLGRNLEMKRLREDRSTHVDEECTFYPKTNVPSSHCYTDRGAEKSRELYQHAKSKQEQEKHNQSVSAQNRNDHGLSQFSEISRQTLKTEANRNKVDYGSKNKSGQGMERKSPTRDNERKGKVQNNLYKSPGECLEYAKDVDKTVARMALGRKQRQFKNRLLQRGEPDLSQKKPSPIKPSHNLSSTEFNPAHNASSNTFANPQTFRQAPEIPEFASPSDYNEPFLVIDINMGEEMDQIEFYSGDEKKVGQIVDEFCLDHDLDDECKEQLLQLVEIQMVRYLNNMGAESTEC